MEENKQINQDMRETLRLRSGNSKKGVDLVIVTLVIVLTAIGIITIYSASYVQAGIKYGDPQYFLTKSLTFGGLGIGVAFFMMNFNYRFLKTKFIVGASTLGTLILFGMLYTSMGVSANGSLRWVNFFNITTIQPSEVAKLSSIIWVAFFVSHKDFKITGFNARALRNIAIAMSLPLLYMVLIAIQPAMTTAVILAFICFYILFLGGINWMYVALVGSAGIGAGILLLLAKPYRWNRLMVTFDPFADPTGLTFQALQSVFAISSGGLAGLGLGASRQKYLYLPEAQNDFIFAIWCEETGFIGAIILVALFTMLIIRCFKVANNAQDKFGSLLVSGVTAHIAIQFLLNLGVAMSIFPNTGVGLPFISYGGSSLIILLAEIGIVLNISKHERRV